MKGSSSRKRSVTFVSARTRPAGVADSRIELAGRTSPTPCAGHWVDLESVSGSADAFSSHTTDAAQARLLTTRIRPQLLHRR